jgi:VanZ family protein
MSRMLRVSARTIPMFAVMGIIFFLSSVPGDHLVLPEIVNIDKVAHMAIYGLLAGTVFFAFGGRLVCLYPRLVPLLVIFICILYGISDEFHQSFVPNRMPSFADILADGCGAVIVCLLLAAKIHLRKKRSCSCKETSVCL